RRGRQDLSVRAAEDAYRREPLGKTRVRPSESARDPNGSVPRLVSLATVWLPHWVARGRIAGLAVGRHRLARSVYPGPPKYRPRSPNDAEESPAAARRPFP